MRLFLQSRLRCGHFTAALFAVISLPSALIAQMTELRTWTNQQGRTVNARFIETSGGNVVLELENGTRSNVPLATLSQTDQAYVQAMPAAAAPPSVSTTPAGPLAWPAKITVNAKALEVTPGRQDAPGRQFEYQTGSFSFISNAPLTGSVMQGVAADFELTRAAIEQFPWGFAPKPKEGDFFKVYLAETDQDYVALGGGDVGSADSKDDYVFIKFSALQLKKVGQRYAFDLRADNPKNVVGMTVRVMIWDMRNLLYPWLTSGMEQVMGKVAYHRGTMRFSGMESNLKEFADSYLRSVTPDMQRMLSYLREGNVTRTRDTRQALLERIFDSTLLFYYFAFLEGDGSGARLHQYLRDVAEETLAWRAYRESGGKTTRPRDRDAGNYNEMARSNNEKFLAGLNDQQLEQDIIAKYQAIGVKLAR